MASGFLVLNDAEVAVLQKPVRGRGGFQNLMLRLQGKFRTGASELGIDAHDIEQIQHYAFDYDQGGWEGDLLAIFSRHLGPTLGRETDVRGTSH